MDKASSATCRGSPDLTNMATGNSGNSCCTRLLSISAVACGRDVRLKPKAMPASWSILAGANRSRVFGNISKLGCTTQRTFFPFSESIASAKATPEAMIVNLTFLYGSTVEREVGFELGDVHAEGVAPNPEDPIYG